MGITVASQYNGIYCWCSCLLIKMAVQAIVHTVSNADYISTFSKQSTEHTSFYDTGTPQGNRTYTYTNISDSQAQPMTMVTASWK